jgi:hypothetical protein
MIDETQPARLLEGFRAKPAADVETLVDSLDAFRSREST